MHVTKEGPQDLATLDRAIGELRAVLSRRTTGGKQWYEVLKAAIAGMNAMEHSALFNREPDDVAGDEDLRFDLRYKNAEMRQVNVELARTRGENLEQRGACRTLLKPTTGFRRRAGQQVWSEKIHQVASAGDNGRVLDTEGNKFLMSIVACSRQAGTRRRSPASSRRSETSAPHSCSLLSCGPTKSAWRSGERRTSCLLSERRRALKSRTWRRALKSGRTWRRALKSRTWQGRNGPGGQHASSQRRRRAFKNRPWQGRNGPGGQHASSDD